MKPIQTCIKPIQTCIKRIKTYIKPIHTYIKIVNIGLSFWNLDFRIPNVWSLFQGANSTHNPHSESQMTDFKFQKTKKYERWNRYHLFMN